ncbi:hypothetical protein SUDANB19_05049 [Streptomyces sp. enrichment culture]
MRSCPLRPGAGGQGRAQAPTAGRGSGCAQRDARLEETVQRGFRGHGRGPPPRPTGTGTGTGRVTGLRGDRSHRMRLRPTAGKRQPCPADRRGNARLRTLPFLRSCRLTMAWVARNREPGALDPDSRRPRPRDAGRGSPLCERKPGPKDTHGGQSSTPRLLGNSETVSQGRSHRAPRPGRARILRVPGAAPTHRTSQGRAAGPPFGPAPVEPQRDGQRSGPRSCNDTEAGCPGRVPSPDTRPVWKPGADRPSPGPTDRRSGRRPDSRLPAAGQCSRGAGTTWSAPPGAPGLPA